MALGLALVFLLLSLVVSGAVEALSWLINRRSNDLERGLRQVLEGENASTKELSDKAKEILEHPLITGLQQPLSGVRGWRGLRKFAARKPSYIPSRRFSLAVMDVIAPEKGAKSLDDVRQKLDGLPDALRDQIEPLLKFGDKSIADFRKSLEASFDEVMQRVSGWYKRWSQLLVCLFAILAAVGFNASAVRIAENLWADDVLREAVASSAVEVAEGRDADATSEPACTRLDGVRGETAGTAAESFDESTCATLLAGEATDTALSDLEALDLPIGWEGQRFWDTVKSPAAWVGWLITFFAVSLGAPFWFDALSRIARLRTTGGKPQS